MAHINARRPIAAAAVFASALGAVAGFTGQANATSYGETGSPVTVLHTDGTMEVTGGGTTINLPAGAHDASWAGQGGRVAFIEADGTIATADYDGSHIVKLAHSTNASHTVWDPFSTIVYWTEGTGASAKLVGTVSNGAYYGAVDPKTNAYAETFDALPAAASMPTGVGFSNLDVAGDKAGTTVFEITDASGNHGIGLISWTDSGAVYQQLVAPGDALSGGTNPTVSSDGTAVVFQRQVGTDSQLFATKLTSTTWSTPAQITAKAGSYTDPIFEADLNHTSVAYKVAYDFAPDSTNTTDSAGVFDLPVATALTSGPDATTETQLSATPGSLAVRTDSKSVIQRFAGADRFASAVLASKAAWADAGDTTSGLAQAQTVVLARSDNFADALGGAALAAHKGGPLLLTETNSLDPETQGEIGRILPAGSTIYVLGGTGAIAPAVVSKLALHYTVVRIGGVDRFDTAVQIANATDPNASNFLVATGTNYPDALSAGAVAASFKSTVVLLTNGNSMPAETETYLETKANAKNMDYLGAIGAPASNALTSKGWGAFDNESGATRYETSLNVAQNLFGSFGTVGVATGANWPDSLAGGALMGHVFGPLLLADPSTGLTAAADAFLDANRGATNWGYIFGGTGALGPRIDTQLANDIQTATGVQHLAVKAAPADPAFPKTTPDVTAP